MLVSIQPVPFADAGRQRQFEAVAETLRADAAPATVLLGNLGAFAPVVVDALLVRPTSVVVLCLTPRAGELTLPASPDRPWVLDGQPLTDSLAAGNPLAHYQQQLPRALAWLSAQLGVPVAELPPCAGLALFEAPLTFAADVETNLHRQATAHDFQLLGGVNLLPSRLPLCSETAVLHEDELLDWADWLANEPYVAHQHGEPASVATYLAQKLGQLWRWLGAEDIPADPPYGGFPSPDLAQRDRQEQARLHQLRQELQAELAQQRREAATREAAYTQELTQLRQQVAQTGQPATRQAEQRAQAALEAEMRAARTELATRHRELDARIQELGRLMQQLQAQANVKAAAPAASPTSVELAPRQGTTALPRATTAPAKAARPLLKLSSYRPLRRAERWGALIMGLALLGGGTWGVAHLVSQSAGHARQTTVGRAAARSPRKNAQRPAPVIVYDTLADDSGLYQTDTDPADVSHTPSALEAMPANASFDAPMHTDSTQLVVPATPLLPRDTTAAEASPTP